MTATPAAHPADEVLITGSGVTAGGARTPWED
jgi:hypothetical protein